MSEFIIDSIREGYDRVADEYARHLFEELQGKPLDRELLTRFASEMSGRGSVCDLGCGPGHVARYLRDAGAQVSGMDLSPRMVEMARRLSPEIRFDEGNMLQLSLDSETLSGITAFYAIVNLEFALLPRVFREMHRVLVPGGLLLLAFHTGDEVNSVEEMWGQQVSLDFFFFQPATIQASLEEAGFVIEEVIEREPYAPEVEHQSRRAYIFARKPRRVAERSE
jgi:SAM-dependent methyltransferase